jgi:hypothetical protein
MGQSAQYVGIPLTRSRLLRLNFLEVFKHQIVSRISHMDYVAQKLLLSP